MKRGGVGGNKQPATVFHSQISGAREVLEESLVGGMNSAGGKYGWLSEYSVSTSEWQRILPAKPFYLFVPQDKAIAAEYEEGWKITDIMPINVLGFQTHRDHFAIDIDASTLRRRFCDMRESGFSDIEFAERYAVRDSQSWNLKDARRLVREDPDWARHITKCHYRPFDWRACFFSSIAMDRPRRELLDHVLNRDNLCLLVPRKTSTLEWRHALCATHPASALATEIKEGSYVFPLYLYPAGESTQLLKPHTTSRTDNLSTDFLTSLSGSLGLFFVSEPGKGDRETTFSPEDVFAYIYSILHAPSFRQRYAEFLKADFPRIPLTSNV